MPNVKPLSTTLPLSLSVDSTLPTTSISIKLSLNKVGNLPNQVKSHKASNWLREKITLRQLQQEVLIRSKKTTSQHTLQNNLQNQKKRQKSM